MHSDPSAFFLAKPVIPVIPSNEITIAIQLNSSTQTNILRKSQHRLKERVNNNKSTLIILMLFKTKPSNIFFVKKKKDI